MRAFALLLMTASALCATSAWGQADRPQPHIGYLYPAGGQQGQELEVLIGGQHLRGATNVHVTGNGARAEIVEYYRPVKRLDVEQRRELERRMRGAWRARLSELPNEQRAGLPQGSFSAGKGRGKPKRTEPEEAVALPPHPLLRDIESMSLHELVHVRDEIHNFRKKQENAQIAEMVLVKVTIDTDAEPGDRELRIVTPLGITNPMVFQVGTTPEVLEQEPNDPKPAIKLPKLPPTSLPAVLNGQIMPGDVDGFAFTAAKGQQLVIDARARHLVPYLADAVPGWFQATIALYDSKGSELAFEDDYRFNPDPVMFFLVPEDGTYELEIRDSIYRGREDFVYRVAIGQQPFITGMFPLGGVAGEKTTVSISGWNLPQAQLALDTAQGDGVRLTSLRGGLPSNEVPYCVGTLRECSEAEPNDSAENAQGIALPMIVNGRVSRHGDVDVFRFEGRAGDKVVAEVMGRALHSPLDSLLRLSDTSGKVLEWNDDHMEMGQGYLFKNGGLLTHHADSYLSATLPENGTYFVELSDSQQSGGDAYAYRLRLTPPRPDFELRVTPSSISVPAGGSAPLSVHALRKDGFSGEIELALEDAPAGFFLSGGGIPGGAESIRLTVTAPREGASGAVSLRLRGQARIGDNTVDKQAIPVEDMMQAFLYRHLAPSKELIAWVAASRRPWPRMEYVGRGPVRLTKGGTAMARLAAPTLPNLDKVWFDLSEPPKGVTLDAVTAGPKGLQLFLKADADSAEPGFRDNLIVEVFSEMARRGPGGKGPGQKVRVPLGVLPAIPVEIVQ